MKATERYKKRLVEEGKLKRFGMLFWLPKEKGIYDHLSQQKDRSGYIKALIEKDMEG